MKRKTEDNTISVIRRAIYYYRIKVTNNSVKETLISNSYYPTFKSICDAFNEWKIEHYPLKYDMDEIKDLKTPYITHFNSGGGQIAFVTGHENGRVVLYDSFKAKKKLEWDEYIKKSSGAIILLNPDANSGEKNYDQKFQKELLNKIILPAIIGAVALLIFTFLINRFFGSDYLIPWQQYILLFTKFAGIFFSTLLLLKEYEIQMPLSEKICHISKSINCDGVLNDKAAKVFGPLGWADIGMIYFTGSILVMLQTNFQTMNGYLIIASALSLPYTFFSVWYQGFKIKKWCTFCLMVQVILVVEFLILAPFLRDAYFSFNLFAAFILIFLVVGTLHVLVALYIGEYRSARYNFNKLQRFKSHPGILHTLILSQKHYDIKITDKSFLFGEMNSDLRITAFLSLHCSHCAGAFTKIVEVLKSYTDALVNIVLTGPDSKILDTLYFLLKNGKENEALNMIEHWYKSDHHSRAMFADDYYVVDAGEVSREINTENRTLMKDCEVTGTPTFFINGYRLPNLYEINDIKYFSEIFNKKVEVGKGDK